MDPDYMDVDVDLRNFVSDDEINISPEEEADWDDKIRTRGWFPPTLSTDTTEPTWAVLIMMVVAERHFLDQKYRSPFEALKLLRSHESFLRPIFVKCCQIQSWRMVRRLRLLQKPREVVKTIFDSSGVEATEASWRTDFMGSAPEALWKHVCTVHRQDKVYAPFTAIIQSSGMGKSRLVDELAKNHFVIPICLRKQNRSAFPPGDPDVYKFLVGYDTDTEPTEVDVLLRIHVFLIELFRETISFVKKLKCSPASYAAAFRDYMTEGQTMRGHGKNRVQFYQRVVKNADELFSRIRPKDGALPEIDETDGKHKEAPKYKCGDFTADDMARELVRVLEGSHLEEPESPTPAAPKLRAGRKSAKPEAKVQEEPKFILSLDEAHELTNVRGSDVWITFNQFRRALRAVNRAGKPMFTLFLSMTGSVVRFNPSVEYEPSLRVMRRPFVGPAPFTDLGFDQCVEHISEGDVTLEEVSQIEFMVQFGRPMFATRYRSGNSTVRDNIVAFASEKLLGKGFQLLGRGLGTQELSLAQKLACLSYRFPINFLTTHYNSKEAQEVRDQVEHHMRVVLKIEDEFRSMKAVCPSEPLLSEAASVSMQDSKFSPPFSLLAIFSRFAVDRGDRGELIGLLLLTMARDRPLVDISHTTARVISVTTFLQNLFRPEPQDITDVLPSRFKTIHDQGIPLKDKFANAKLHFNHFIKVHSHNMLERRFAWRHVCRGAAILCANSQIGVDAYIPFTFETSKDEQGEITSKLEASNMGLILCQFKNDPRYSDEPEESLFTHMDPFDLHIFEKDEDCNVPLIRIVFAMAGEKPSLKSPVAPSESRFTSYDIWCSGLSSEYYQVIGPGADSEWRALLDANPAWQAMYKPDSHGLRQAQNPGAADEEEFFKNWAPFE